MIPEFTVSPKLLENMLSIRVAEVLVILVGYVMFGNNEFVVKVANYLNTLLKLSPYLVPTTHNIVGFVGSY